MIAVIMAGGKGTRLRELTGDEIPKPMLPVKGKPILEWQIEELKKYGISDVVFIIGYLGEKIEQYFADGSRFGIRASYIKEEQPLGSAGAFYYLKNVLKEKNASEFMLVFGDIFFDFDIDRMAAFHHEKNALVTLLAHPNMHPYDSDLVRTDKDDKVIAFDSKHNVRDYSYDNLVNAGMYMMKTEVCELVKEPVKTDLEHDLLAKLVEDGEGVYAYRTPEFIRDIGTVDRVEKTIVDIDSGLVAAKNLKKRQKAIFLDRDGTLNVYKGLVRDVSLIELTPNAAEAVRRINSAGYLAIMITNQPVIARGEVTVEELEDIHNRIKTLLGKEGAYLDDIYYCPHHPDKGFEGEIPELKIECDCRKPKPGMILKAADKYNIDLSKSWMIGDMKMDIQCGINAGCSTAFLETGHVGEDHTAQPTREADITAYDVLDAVKKILGD